MSNDADKLNRIEELKSKLFSKNFKTKIEHRDNFSRSHASSVPDGWDTGSLDNGNEGSLGEKFFVKTTIFKKFFLFALGFFILTLAYGAYVLFTGGNTVSNDNIDISILGNNFTSGGEDLSLVVGITNKNASALDLADLVMEYPKNSVSSSGDVAATSDSTVATPVGTDSFRKSLGTIPAGAIRNESLKVTLFGEQGSVVPIKISLEYRVAGSNGVFVKEKDYNVTISSTPLDLSVDAPATITPNQSITLNVKATLNATRPASKMLLKVDYPIGFQFTSASPAPTLGNNTWALGDLAPGAQNNISINGKMIDVLDGEQKTFHISAGSQSSDDKSVIDVVFNSLPYVVTIKKPFVDARLLINGVNASLYATDSKTPVHGQIQWTNNLDTKVDDLAITATFSGNALDKKTINAEQGFYNSNKNLITWDKNSDSQFAEVNPGDSGTVGFSLSPVSLFSSGLGILSDPVINIDVSISGKQLISGFEPTVLNNSSTGVIHIISDVGFATKALYYSGAFTNHGPIPPAVGKETSYTVVWSLSNTSNNISKAVVRSSLPQWMNYAGTVSPADQAVTYNTSTKEIVWNIGSIPKGTGISGVPLTASFQVSFTPSISQVGTSPVIINDAVLTGHDDFANVDVRVSKSSLRTSLDSDPSFPPSGGVVAQ